MSFATKRFSSSLVQLQALTHPEIFSSSNSDELCYKIGLIISIWYSCTPSHIRNCFSPRIRMWALLQKTLQIQDIILVQLHALTNPEIFSSSYSDVSFWYKKKLQYKFATFGTSTAKPSHVRKYFLHRIQMSLLQKTGYKYFFFFRFYVYGALWVMIGFTHLLHICSR